MRPYLTCLVCLLLLLGIPTAIYGPSIRAIYDDSVDAVSSASLEVPDSPSGEYILLLSTQNHPQTLEQWTAFFREEPTDVIFEDLACLTIVGDAGAKDLARHYQARLATNQMTLRQDSALLVASRAQWGHFDLVILSREVAEQYSFQTVPDTVAARITIHG